jgi:hypothetical protein
VDRARVVGNDLTGLTKRKPEGEELGGHRPRGSGVFVQPGLSPAPIDIEVLDNRLDRFGYGIGITRPLGAATLARNLITRMSVGGIAMSQDATAVQLAIHDNQLREIAAAEDDTEGDLAAIRVVGVVDLGLARNSLLGFATKAIKATAREAIVVVAGADSRVSDNHLADIGPPREYSGGATGIRFVGWLQTAGVHQNSIARTSDASLEPEFSGWSGIDVLGVDGDPEQPDMWAAAGDAAVFVLKSRAVLLTATHAHQFHHTRGQGDVAITGNEIVAGATHERPLNVGLVRGCRLVGNRLQSIPRAVSLVWCRRAIVCNNDIRSEETEALNIRLDDQKEAAVVANVTTGEILLNGNSLPSPYHDLNPRVFD